MVDEIFNLFDDFMGNKDVKKVLSDPDDVFYNLIQSEFSMPMDVLMYRPDISKGEIKGFKKRLDTLTKNIKKGDFQSKFGSIFYTPSNAAKHDPAVGQLLDSFLQVQNNYKGHQANAMARFDLITTALKRDMSEQGFVTNSIVSTGKALTRTSARAKAEALDAEILDTIARIKNGDTKLVKKLNRLEDEQAILHKDTELDVHDEMIHLIENGIPEVVQEKHKRLIKIEEAKGKKGKFVDYNTVSQSLSDVDFSKLKLRDGSSLGERKNLLTAVRNYHKLMADMHVQLSNGTKAYVESIIATKQSQLPKESLMKLRDSMLEKLMPNMETGFFPHYSRDLSVDFLEGLMPRLDDLAVSSSNYTTAKSNPTKAMEDLESYLSGHARTRSDDLKYSHNFVNVVGSYINEVNRFNQIAHFTKAKADILNKIETMYKEGADTGKYIENVTDYINDMHSAAVGKNAIENKELNAFVRTLLGFEFISKIGMNPRSAARNASQMLLNFVEWSPIQIKTANDAIKEFDVDIQEDMRKNGLLFQETAPELEESLAGQASAFKSLHYNKDTGRVETIKQSGLEKVASVVSNVAGSKFVAGMTRAVENKNREMTFRIAYGRMLNILDNPNFVNAQNAKNMKSKGTELTEKQLNAIKRRYAENYATKMVTSLHFDYSDFSKAKAIRGPVGKVLGQFQHYAFKFFEKNQEILRKGGNDILSREFNGENAWKTYRLGLVYFAAPWLASTLTGIDFGNLVEHDAATKVEKLGAIFWGDKEDREEAFYGKGPVLGTIGAPVMSDLITFGQLFDVINWEEDSMMSLLAGYQDYSNTSGDHRAYHVVKTLSTALGRTGFRTLPQMLEGNLGSAMQYELGLYPTAEARKRKKKLKKSLPPELLKSLEQLEKMGYSR